MAIQRPLRAVRGASSSLTMISWIFSPGRIPRSIDGDIAVADERRRHVRHQGRRDIGDEDLARLRELDRGEHRVDRLIETQEEPCHVAGRDRDRAAMADLVMEQRDDRAPRREDVAVADADESRVRGSACSPGRTPSPGSPSTSP